MVPVGEEGQPSVSSKPLPALARHQPIRNPDALVPTWDEVLDAEADGADAPRPVRVAAPSPDRLSRHRGFSPRAYLRGFTRRTPRGFR